MVRTMCADTRFDGDQASVVRRLARTSCEHRKRHDGRDHHTGTEQIQGMLNAVSRKRIAWFGVGRRDAGQRRDRASAVRACVERRRRANILGPDSAPMRARKRTLSVFPAVA